MSSEWRTLLHPVFVVSALLFVAEQLLERVWSLYIPWLHEYLDDLLAMPVVLGLSLFIFRKIHPHGAAYRFAWGHVIFTVVYFALIFELTLPYFSTTYTSDPWDLLFYSVGGVIFYYTINQS